MTKLSTLQWYRRPQWFGRVTGNQSSIPGSNWYNFTTSSQAAKNQLCWEKPGRHLGWTRKTPDKLRAFYEMQSESWDWWAMSMWLMQHQKNEPLWKEKKVSHKTDCSYGTLIETRHYPGPGKEASNKWLAFSSLMSCNMLLSSFSLNIAVMVEQIYPQLHLRPNDEGEEEEPQLFS